MPDTHPIPFTPGNLSRGAGPSPNSEVAPTQRCSAVAGTIDCDIPKQRVQNMAAGRWLAVPIQDGREIAKSQNGLGIGGEGDPSYTLDQTGAQAVAIQGNLIGRDVCGPQGVGASTDGAMYTLTKADIHGVAVPFRKSHGADAGEVAPTLRAMPHDGSHANGGGQVAIAFHPTQDPISSIDGTTHAMGCGSKQGTATVAVATQMVVRRLTPVECERLQGFPDDYTNIPWRGKPESPDGPRYKALGNSMAVNCMRWIGRRIDAVEKGTELPA